MKAVEGWQKGRLGELCSIEIGGTPSRSNPDLWDASKETLNLWVSIRDLNRTVITDTAEHISDSGVKHSNVKLQNSGTVLLSFKLSIGRVAFAGLPLYTNEAIAGLNSNKIDLNYLFHGLHHWDLLRGVDQAIKGATLNKEKLKKITFEYPKSITEQAKIAKVLSTVDRAIEQTEALIAKQQRIKTGLMQDLLTRGIDEESNLRSEQTHKFKDSPLGRIPEEWEVTDWGSVGYWKGGSTPSKGDPKNWINGINLWVSPKDIRASILETTEDLLTDQALTTSKLHVFQAGSIFIVFRSGILKHTIPISTCNKPFSVNQDIKVLIPKSETNIKFLGHLLKYYSPIILRIAVKAGTTVESIDRLIFEGMKIPYPDLPEQTRISDVLDQHEYMSIMLKNELIKLRSLKTALMQDLLTGKKRVTDLLNDTEAAIL